MIRLLMWSSATVPWSATSLVVTRRSCLPQPKIASESVVIQRQYDGIACHGTSDVRVSCASGHGGRMASRRALRNFVNGEWADAADGRTFDLVDPSTGEAFASSP